MLNGRACASARSASCFEKFNLLPTLDARSNILIAQEISGLGNRDQTHFDRITGLGLGTSDWITARRNSPAANSNASRSRAPYNKPAIVLADKPTGNLDSKNSDVVLAMLRRKSQQELARRC